MVPCIIASALVFLVPLGISSHSAATAMCGRWDLRRHSRGNAVPGGHARSVFVRPPTRTGQPVTEASRATPGSNRPRGSAEFPGLRIPPSGMITKIPPPRRISTPRRIAATPVSCPAGIPPTARKRIPATGMAKRSSRINIYGANFHRLKIISPTARSSRLRWFATIMNPLSPPGGCSNSRVSRRATKGINTIKTHPARRKSIRRPCCGDRRLLAVDLRSSSEPGAIPCPHPVVAG